MESRQRATSSFDGQFSDSIDPPRPKRSRPPRRQHEAATYSRDALTGLHGQKYLCRSIDACLAESRKRKLSATLALLQLENFYEIRSWVGLSEADLLLSDIAQLLKAALPKRVLLCRCHNFEFAVLLLAGCSVNARLITDKLKQALLSTVSPSLPRQLELKCGVGLAKLESNIPSWPVVFARARHNLSLAHHQKELPAHLASISPELALKHLQAALATPKLELNHQALVRLVEHPLEHYEVRCSLSQHEISSPTLLLFETAARNAFGEQIDRRVIEQVLAQLEDVAKPHLRLVVNLSHNSLVSIKFLRWLEERLSNKDSLASQLIFQISETDALIAQHHLISFCDVIKRLGCKLSLSNFGCTPKPLRYLSLVPASYVKLDTSLLRKIDVNQTNRELLDSLITELHERSIKVITPMLEQPSALPLFWKANVDFLQGNCLHAPSSHMDYEFLCTRSVNFV